MQAPPRIGEPRFQGTLNWLIPEIDGPPGQSGGANPPPLTPSVQIGRDGRRLLPPPPVTDSSLLHLHPPRGGVDVVPPRAGGGAFERPTTPPRAIVILVFLVGRVEESAVIHRVPVARSPVDGRAGEGEGGGGGAGVVVVGGTTGEESAGLDEALHVPADPVRLLREYVAVIGQHPSTAARGRGGAAGRGGVVVQLAGIVLIRVCPSRQGFVGLFEIRQAPR